MLTAVRSVRTLPPGTLSFGCILRFTSVAMTLDAGRYSSASGLGLDIVDPRANVREYRVYKPGRSMSLWHKSLLTLSMIGTCFLIIGGVTEIKLEEHVNACISIIVLVFGVNLFLADRTVLVETVSVIRGLGVELSTRRASGRTTTAFLHHSSIGAVLLNEGISMWRVVYYLALLVRGSDHKESLKLAYSTHFLGIDLLARVLPDLQEHLKF